MPGGPELSEKLPDEIFQLVESFKKFVREQKAFRDQKFDVETILEVERDTEDFTLAFQRVAVDSDRNTKLIQQIKDDTTTLLRHSELAYSLLRSHFANNPSFQQQHSNNNPQNSASNNLGGIGSRLGAFDSTIMSNSGANQQNNLLHQQQPFYLSGNVSSMNQHSPYGSSHHHNHNQFANTSTSQYFSELADQFEARMKAYGEQIKELKMSLDSIIKTYDIDELFKWLKKQHETLGEIAAKVYMTHERIMEKAELEKQQQHLTSNNMSNLSKSKVSFAAT